MNTPKHFLTRRHPANLSRGDTWKHVVIWLLLILAALLLAGFTAVVDDITQRGELRRVHQQVSGSLKLPDDLSTSGNDLLEVLALTRYKLGAH